MMLFFQIFAANAVLLAAFIVVHEVGHWTMGWLAGLPARDMRIRLLTFPQQVVLREGAEWVSVADFARYHALLKSRLPSPGRQYAYVVGGFMFETVFAIGLSWLLAGQGRALFAALVPGLSLSMYLVYVFAMDLPTARKLGKPWGDTTYLYSLAPRTTLAVSAAMVGLRVLAIVAGALSGGA